MNKDDFENYIKDRYQSQIDWYDKKSMANQKMYQRLQFSLIVLSSLTPILILIDQLKELEKYNSLFWVPAVTSVLVAIITTLIKTYRFQENWINYRTTCESLKKELHYYEANLDEYMDSKNKESVFVNRVENLISRENTLWLHTQKPPKDQK